MKLAIDTNAYRALDGGDTSLLGPLGVAEVVALPMIVMAEIHVGAMLGNRQAENLERLQRFITSTGGTILRVDDDTPDYYARTFVQLRKQGTPIPTNDIWIAALCLQYGYSLATFDTDFLNVPLLEVIGAKQG